MAGFHLSVVVLSATLGFCAAVLPVMQVGAPQTAETALKTGAAIGASAPMGAAGACGTDYMFILPAQNVTISKPDAKMNVNVTMVGVARGIIFHTETPNKLAGRIPLANFSTLWGADETWSPSTVLVGYLPNNLEKTVVINVAAPPVFKNTTNTLTMTGTVVMQNTATAKSAATATDTLKNVVVARTNSLMTPKELATNVSLSDVLLFIDSRSQSPVATAKSGVIQADPWKNYFQQTLGRPSAFPDNTPWPY